MKFKKHKNPMSQEVFFDKLYVLERELYTQILCNQQNGKKYVSLLKEMLVSKEELSDKIDSLLFSISKSYTKKMYSSDKFYKLIAELVGEFYVMDAPREWANYIVLANQSDNADWAIEIRNRFNSITKYRNKFVEENLYLVKIAISMYDGSIAEEDNLQEATFGILRAIDKFDVKKGSKFSTYAVFWARHYISRNMSDKSNLIRMPVHLGERNRAIKLFKGKYFMEHGKKPSIEEISVGCDIPIDSVEHAATNQTVLSFDKPITENDDTTFYDIHIDDDVDNQCDVSHLFSVRKRITYVMRREKFSKRDRDIIKSRFGFSSRSKENTDGDMILADVAKKYNVCRERIRQIENNLLSKMRPYFENNDLCA